MEGISVVAVTDELVCDLLGLLTCAAEDDPVDVGVVVCDTFERKILVLS